MPLIVVDILFIDTAYISVCVSVGHDIFHTQSDNYTYNATDFILTKILTIEKAPL